MKIKKKILVLIVVFLLMVASLAISIRSNRQSDIPARESANLKIGN
ncbi:MAG TPA: hypothetical protein PLS75_04190 [Candidatus Marinimicrobia bacterium]|nr:hypothetical protein [Candidatus Neomarinimicrobiota bacterium]HPI27659.1 hypothetical protein [Candidatus Neomarinimicrobiota bacterium]HPY00100.1 hypothetical protein [Candidatus Neomarinimicrobiota bacterium]HQC61770.1 hypothetical protein [Candidatus Neomarinimicrobiota bacterium]HQO74966.1 hypothetical protein [Candidatus Neomarinimicrobiota bacterium]